MRQKSISTRVVFFLVLGVTMIFAVSVAAQDYEALEGVKHANTVFDFRDGIPKSASIHLSLVHKTYQDKAIQGLAEKSDFVVVFMASSVKLLSSNRNEFTAEEKKALEQLDQVIAAMAKDGIKMEICLFAAKSYGVNPESISQEIDRVPNGWIASLGYQAQGYALVPAY